MSGWLEGPVLSILEKGLDASSLKQKVLANNIANIDTPGFKRSEVDFQAVLGTALAQKAGNLPLKLTSTNHLPGVDNGAGKTVIIDDMTNVRNDQNNVDIDHEMANVAENGLYYNAITRTLSSQLGFLRMVIQEKP